MNKQSNLSSVFCSLSSDNVTDPSSLPKPSIDIQAGHLRVRLAETEEDLLALQRLRYEVFYEEMQAVAKPEITKQKRDFDKYDPYCDHLMVIHEDAENKKEHVVGGYRLIRKEIARQCGGFYTEQEFNIDKLLGYSDKVLELGRACIGAKHRDRPTMQLLWQGVATYMNYYRSEFLFGCASFPGTDVASFAAPLSYLYHYHLAPEEYLPQARPEFYQEMNVLPKEGLDARRLLIGLPPLLKSYIRMGGYIGEGAVIDHDFNTTDVCILVKIDQMTDRYYNHYVRRFDDSDKIG